MRLPRGTLSTGNFYSLFLTVFVIFSTIFFIQLASNFNIPVEKNTDRNKFDFTTIESRSGENFELPAGLLNVTRRLPVSFKNHSHLVTQHIVREQTRLHYYNKTESILDRHETKTIFATSNESVEQPNGKYIFMKHSSVLNDSDTFLLVKEEISPHSNESDRSIIGKLQINITDSQRASLPENNTSDKTADDNVLKFSRVQVGAIINESVVIERNVSRLREHYLKTNDSSRRLQKAIVVKRPNYCPLWPSELVGPLEVDKLINLTEIPETNKQLIKDGGHFTPPDCRPRERTAVIIPYRDRAKHLAVLLRHLHTVLQRQKIEYAIYVVEVAYPAQFNRGLLANVGFLTASSIATYTCYIIHDVDLLMTDDRNMYRCGRVPRHLAATSSKYKTKLPYLAYFGGVEAFTPEQFWKVNGFSNLYFGWGGEDDDIVYRIFGTDQHFSRPRHQIGGYVAMEHSKDSANPPNPHRINLVKKAVERMPLDGVKNVQYTRLALEFKPLYTWVFVAVKEAKIMEKFQKYLEEN